MKIPECSPVNIQHDHRFEITTFSEFDSIETVEMNNDKNENKINEQETAPNAVELIDTYLQKLIDEKKSCVNDLKEDKSMSDNFELNPDTVILQLNADEMDKSLLDKSNDLRSIELKQDKEMKENPILDSPLVVKASSSKVRARSESSDLYSDNFNRVKSKSGERLKKSMSSNSGLKRSSKLSERYMYESSSSSEESDRRSSRKRRSNWRKFKKEVSTDDRGSESTETNEALENERHYERRRRRSRKSYRRSSSGSLNKHRGLKITYLKKKVIGNASSNIINKKENFTMEEVKSFPQEDSW